VTALIHRMSSWVDGPRKVREDNSSNTRNIMEKEKEEKEIVELTLPRPSRTRTLHQETYKDEKTQPDYGKEPQEESRVGESGFLASNISRENREVILELKLLKALPAA